MNQDKIVMKGEVVKKLPDFRFRVLTEYGNEILAYSSGNMKKRKKAIQPGDTVVVEVSVYDMQRGRLVDVIS